MIVDLPTLLHARLTEKTATLFALIGGAAALTAAQQSAPAQLPAAFVLHLSEAPTTPPLAGEFIQRKQHRTAVVLAMASTIDPSAPPVTPPDFLLLRQAVESALLGWTPDGCAEPLVWAAGKLLQLPGSDTFWWQDEFMTTQLVKLP